MGGEDEAAWTLTKKEERHLQAIENKSITKLMMTNKWGYTSVAIESNCWLTSKLSNYAILIMP